MLHTCLRSALLPLHTRTMYRQARLTKICNYAGSPDVTDERGIRIIGQYQNKKNIDVGDVVKVTYKGDMYKVVITGLKKDKYNHPRFDSNNCVFVNDKYEPLGTRINGPLPLSLRSKQKFSKLLSLGKEFY